MIIKLSKHYQLPPSENGLFSEKDKLDHKQFTDIKKANVSLDGILKSDNDSIYYLDEDVPDNYKKQMKKSKQKKKVPLTNVASRIVQINNGSGNSNTLRNLK